MTLTTLLPVALFAAVIGYLLVQEQRETSRAGAEARTLAVLTAIDAELNGHITALQALASLPAFDTGDLAAIRGGAARVLEGQRQWVNVNVALPDGQQVMNLQVPPGQPLPAIGELDGSFARLRETGTPVVSDLAVGPVLKRWSFAVRVPVVRDGALKYVLSAGVNTAAISEVIKAQGLPRDWVGVVVDRNGRIVARNIGADASQGQLASESLRAALAQAPVGWFHGRTIEGTEVYTPYQRSAASGWAFAMGIPAAVVDAVLWRSLAFLVLGLLGAVLIALALARLVSRRIAEPIAGLAAATESLAKGNAPVLRWAHTIAELRTLSAAHEEAARAIREREALVEREKEALRASDRAKDEFLSVLSHELRNPLGALTAAAHVLRTTDPAGEASVKARGIIDRQTRHMARLIGDLLDIGRVSAGKLGLERERMDLSEAVRRVVNTWRTSGRFERHRLSLKLEEVWVDADRARIEQVVANLLDNAIKFSPPDTAIRVAVTAEEGSAVLRVADEGVGIAQDEHGRIFELFVQGQRDTGGMGVGLALVKRLVGLHDGVVTVESAGEGKGATFTVRLPTVFRRQAPAAPPAVLSPARSVLLVEDNDDARQMLEAALASSGHSVRAARDGATGLALASESLPDVALVDIGLPDMDGYDFARRVRAQPGGRGVSLVAITGYGRPQDQERAFAAGFDAHLTKPVTVERLRETLASLQ